MTSNIYIILIFITNILLFSFLSLISKKLNLIDYPNNNLKLHKKPTPLLGGIFIYVNILVYFIFLLFNQDLRPEILASNKSLFNFIFLSSTFFFVGFFDDKIKISANLKFILFIIISFIAVLVDKNLVISKLTFSFMSKEIFLENFSIFFTVLCIVLFVNAFNMFDGINCQASLYALLLFLIIFLQGLDIYIALTFLIPLLFILILNFKNIIFLGNTGSYLIPVILAQIFILSYNKNTFLADEIILLLIFPGLDMLRLFIQRSLKKVNPFSGDKNHIHHLLLRNANILFTLFLTVVVSVSFYIVYFYTNFNILFFLISIVIYYIFIYLLSKRNS
tara:strand:+ start:896 stop:1897 length:1002 start_codon:yes stop_codon:yes gene_type:complete